ncbi:MAG: Si-specific NAD(P)(+) transhydrogenase [Candidatus Hydrogenedentes bacterium]|nr:Si-specific NAD(P)(+) transhydrogenase [Candidatus Hydrogenedentota bacterium]
MKQVDLLVIGSGPAGQRAAIQGVKLGKRVVLVEKKQVVGGVCTNTGTIPSKTLREAILYFSGLRQRSVYGRSYMVKRDVTFSDLRHRIEHVVQHEVEVARDRLMRTGVDIVYGTGSFETPNCVAVHNGAGEPRRFEASKIIIATGTRPYRAERVPFNGRTIIDTDTIFTPGFDMEQLPKTMLIVGGGVVGTEYACMFSAIGTDVRLLDRRLELFRFVDHEINEALTYLMRSERITMYMGKDFKEVREEGGRVMTVLENGREIKTDMLMFASGRTGATEELNLGAAGVQLKGRGLIEVNENLQTSAPHIYAAGDIIGFPALASTSMEQGRQAACHAFGLPFFTDSTLLPYGIYTIPEISMVGKTEQELSEAGIPYEIGIARYREVARGQILGDESGILKLVFHQKTGRLLGVHIIGDGASELVHIGQAVLAHQGSISYFVDTVFNYPTLAEAYKIAALNGLKRIGIQGQVSAEFQAPKDMKGDTWCEPGSPACEAILHE